MPEGIEGMSAPSNTIESATEVASQSAVDTVETGASEFAQDLAQSIEDIDVEQGPQAALENLAGEVSTENLDNSPEDPIVQNPENSESDQGIIDQQAEEQVQGRRDDLQTEDLDHSETVENDEDNIPQKSEEGDSSESSEEQVGQEDGESALLAENKALLAENESLKAELGEKVAQLEAYKNIEQILENIDLTALNMESEQPYEQRKKSLGLIFAALQLALLFFKETAKAENNKNNSIKKTERKRVRPAQDRNTELINQIAPRPKNESHSSAVESAPTLKSS